MNSIQAIRYNVASVVKINDATGICSTAGSQGEALLADTFADVLEAVIKKKARYKRIKKILEGLGKSNAAQELEDAIESAAGKVIDSLGLTEKLKEKASEICAAFGATAIAGQGFADPAKTISFDASLGMLSPMSDGTADFVCTPPSSAAGQSVTLVASKDICRPTSVSKNVNCGATAVTIRFGDNGSLNDDIFSVSVNGEQFSSSSPQREVVGTVQLPSQSVVNVSMRGLAAPDGVGTYYIAFEGATVIGGDATSGSDLTPGVTKTFTIMVD